MAVEQLAFKSFLHFLMLLITEVVVLAAAHRTRGEDYENDLLFIADSCDSQCCCWSGSSEKSGTLSENRSRRGG